MRAQPDPKYRILTDIIVIILFAVVIPILVLLDRLFFRGGNATWNKKDM